MQLENLPFEILIIIFAMLKYKDLNELQLASKRIYKIMKDDNCWKEAFHYRYGTLIESSIVYKEAYIRKFKLNAFWRAVRWENYRLPIESVQHLAVTKQNSIVVGSLNSFAVLNSQTGKLIQRGSFAQNNTFIDLTGQTIVVAAHNGRIQYSQLNGKTKLLPNLGNLSAIKIIAPYILAAHVGSKILIFNLFKNIVIGQLEYDPVLEFVFNGELLICRLAESIAGFQLPFENLQKNSIHINISLIFSWKTRLSMMVLCMNKYVVGFDGSRISTFDIQESTTKYLEKDYSNISCLTVSKSTETVLAGHKNGQISFFRIQNGNLFEFKTHECKLPGRTPSPEIKKIYCDELTIVAGFTSRTVLLIDIATMKNLKTLNSWSANGIFRCFLFTETFFAVCYDTSLWCWYPAKKPPKIKKTFVNISFGAGNQSRRELESEVQNARREAENNKRHLLNERKNIALNGNLVHGMSDDELVEYAMLLSLNENQLTEEEQLALALAYEHNTQ